MAKRKKFGVSFSWKRASGLSAAKGKVSRKLGIPLTRQGRQRKLGARFGCCLALALLVAVGFAGYASFVWLGSALACSP